MGNFDMGMLDAPNALLAKSRQMQNVSGTHTYVDGQFPKLMWIIR
eukprot:SAG31_NODE_1707_length_7484_cov_8.798104_9_plen_45_part_00